jgi:hypothetical protein
MPDLLHSLIKQDLGHLRIVAGLWGIELDSTDEDEAREELSASLLDPELVAELIDSFTPQARDALAALTESSGRIPWATFVRKYGDIREMGAGKRDRERPHLRPASTSEYLFYRAILARAFFDTDKGPQEFAYIPDDLFSMIQSGRGGSRSAPTKDEPLGRGATPGEKNHIIPVDDHILDDATTLLAALRLGLDISPNKKLLDLLHAAGLLKKNIPQAEAVRKFLEASRADALQMLIEAWQSSETFNELRLIPGILCEGEWKNQPQVTREFLLDLLEAIPEGKWWSLIPFMRDIKQKFPDFQRPAGDYDSWFIKRESDGQYLRGFAYWDEVDGALIRFFVTDILRWLGMAELASPDEGKDITAFRLLTVEDLKSKAEDVKLQVTSQGKISVSRFAPRAVRYQVARFCEWDDDKPDEYRYHITPHSLTKAKEQGLKVEQLLALLAKHSDAGIPPALVKALKRWEINGTEARAETQIVLKVSRPEVLEELRKSKAARFLGEPLGPTTITVKSGAIQKVMDALAELGLLAEDNTDTSLRATNGREAISEKAGIASSGRTPSSQRHAKS